MPQKKLLVSIVTLNRDDAILDEKSEKIGSRCASPRVVDAWEEMTVFQSMRTKQLLHNKTSPRVDREQCDQIDESKTHFQFK